MKIKDIIETDKKGKIRKIKLNSQDISKNDVFIPYGGVENRDKYIKDVINKCSYVIKEENKSSKIIMVKNLAKEIITIFNKYYNYPLKNIKLIGITGTDGKTTVTSILGNLLNSSTIGTNGFKLNDHYHSLSNTTPSLDILFNCFSKARDNQEKYIAMEVSSEAYLHKRIGELPFTIGILTNITKDHLDKHKTLKNYIHCKLELIKHSKISILNHDSKYYSLFKQHSQRTYSYGFNKYSTLRIISYKLYFNKSRITFKYKNKKYTIEYPLLGKFNVYNMACSILTLLVLNFDMNDILKKVKNIKPVLGRMEIFSKKNKYIVLDYAHTERATFEVLKFFKKYKKIITVVGCAGDRYKEKRKEIGKIVLKYSLLGIFTMDDPGYEDVKEIIHDMLEKTKRNNYLIILNREEAISKAINLANDDTIILILGKGRDNYIRIGNKKIPYNDFKIIKKYLKRI